MKFQFTHFIILLTGFLILLWRFRPWSLKERSITEVHEPFVILDLKFWVVLFLKIHSTVKNLLIRISVNTLVMHVKTHSWSFNVILLNLEWEWILRLINDWSINGYVGLKYFLPCFIKQVIFLILIRSYLILSIRTWWMRLILYSWTKLESRNRVWLIVFTANRRNLFYFVFLFKVRLTYWAGLRKFIKWICFWICFFLTF